MRLQGWCYIFVWTLYYIKLRIIFQHVSRDSRFPQINFVISLNFLRCSFFIHWTLHGNILHIKNGFIFAIYFIFGQFLTLTMPEGFFFHLRVSFNMPENLYGVFFHRFISNNNNMFSKTSTRLNVWSQNGNLLNP